MALNSVQSVDGLAAYWVQHFEALDAARQAEEAHWTRRHPANVMIVDHHRSPSMRTWLAEHGAKHANRLEQQSEEAVQLELEEEMARTGSPATDREQVPF